jgi:hypothetical protein
VVEPTALDDVIQRIGAEIYRRGSCLVSPHELLLIYDGAEDDSKRFACIRDIAMRYHWAFELPGRMTSVTFKELPAAEPAISSARSDNRSQYEPANSQVSSDPFV